MHSRRLPQNSNNNTMPSSLEYYREIDTPSYSNSPGGGGPQQATTENGASATHTIMYHQKQSEALAYKKEYEEHQKIRLWRIFIVFLLFACTSLYQLNQQPFLVNSYQSYAENNNNTLLLGNNINGNGGDVVQHVHVNREWDRMLFGIFTYDSPTEASPMVSNEHGGN